MKTQRMIEMYFLREEGNAKVWGTKYKVKTYCDFSEPNRKEEIGRHKTLATASRQYQKIWNIYHRIHGHRVWQEEVK